MKKLSVILAMLVTLSTLKSHATLISEDPAEIAATRALALNLPQVQEDFYGMGDGLHPDLYSYVDLDHDDSPEIWVLTHDLQHYMFYKNKGTSLVRYNLPKDYINPKDYENMGWNRIDYVGLYLDVESDPTLKERPLFAKTQMAQNQYCAISTKAVPNPAHYNRMIFKPHVGKIKYNKLVTSDDTEVYFYSLLDKSMSKKMFRGYDDSEVTAVMVNQSFFATHTLWDYSRWKPGEKIRQLTDHEGLKQIIQMRYPEEQIDSTLWVADFKAPLEHKEWSPFMLCVTIFKPDKRGYQRAALMCITDEGILASWDEYGWDHGNGTWYSDDKNDYINHWPNVVAFTMNDDLGLELYISQDGAEGQDVFVLRQAGDQFIRVIEDQIPYKY